MIFQNSHQNEETRVIFLLEKIYVLHKIKRAKYRFNRNTQGSCHQHIYCSLKTWRTRYIFTSRHCWLLVSICVWAQSWWIPVCVGKVTGRYCHTIPSSEHEQLLTYVNLHFQFYRYNICCSNYIFDGNRCIGIYWTLTITEI